MSQAPRKFDAEVRTEGDKSMIEFLSNNWLWILLIVGFVAMHRSGMGCGMGHGGHAGHGATHAQERTEADLPANRDRRPFADRDN
jgi:hypothetical protein